MKDILASTLLKKFQEESLASLYLLSYDPEGSHPMTWVNDFLLPITSLADHPDILKIEKGEKESNYKVDSSGIKELISFLHTRPLALKKKFIFLFDAQDLSTIVSNKLLKIFEELSSDYCLFLFAPENSSVLATVASRAVKLSIKSVQDDKKSEELKSLLSSVQTPQELMQLLKSNAQESKLIEKLFIEKVASETLKKCQTEALSFEELEKLLVKLQNFEKQSRFNNSKLSQITPFFP